MSTLDTIAGYIPVLREQAKAVLDFAKSTVGKVFFATLCVLALAGYAHHRGVMSQQTTIDDLRRELGIAKLQLAAATASPPKPPESVPSHVKGWLEDQAKAHHALSLKVKN